MRVQISVVGVATADTGYVNGQVCVFILLAEILRAAVQYDDQHDDRRQTEQGAYYRKLWEDFEAQSTPEARFALSLDRIQPLTLNYCKHGASWKTHDIQSAQVKQRMQPVYDGSQVLGEYASEIIRRALEEGLLKA